MDSRRLQCLKTKVQKFRNELLTTDFRCHLLPIWMGRQFRNKALHLRCQVRSTIVWFTLHEEGYTLHEGMVEIGPDIDTFRPRGPPSHKYGTGLGQLSHHNWFLATFSQR